MTRTRRPLGIYACLAAAVLTFWPLLHSWPPADAWDVHPWPGAPPLVSTYFEALRGCLFLLGIPYPFARLGQHGPDPLILTTEERRGESTKDTKEHEEKTNPVS